MIKENFLYKIRELPEFIRQIAGLTILIIFIISSFFVLDVIFGQGDELVKKMKSECNYKVPI